MRFKSKRQETFIFVQAISVDYFSKTTLFLTQKLMEKVGSILYLYRKSLCHSMSCSLYTPAPQNLWAQIHDCTWISQCLLCCSCYRTFVRLREYQESGNECLKEYHFSISAFNKTQQPPELRQVFCWESPGQPGILCMLSSKLTEWGLKHLEFL